MRLGDLALIQRGMAFFVAALTVQLCPKMLLTSFWGGHPRAGDEGWVVADMLTMATGEVGDPVTFFVLMIPNDVLFHEKVSSFRFQV